MARGFYGRRIAEKYLLPYINGRTLDRIDMDRVYTPGRLPLPHERDVLKVSGRRAYAWIPGADCLPLSAQRRYRTALPGVPLEAEKRGASFLTGVPVRSVRRVNGGLVINGRIEAKRLVNTILLPDLLMALEGEVEESLKDPLKVFDYNKVTTVAVALKGEAPDHHWVYVPDEDVMFHRYAWLSNYSPTTPREASRCFLPRSVFLLMWSSRRRSRTGS